MTLGGTLWRAVTMCLVVLLFCAALPDVSNANLMRDRQAANSQAQTPPAAPSLLARAGTYINQQQQKFYRALAKSIRAVKEQNSLAAAYSLILLSFIYGIFHAAGPGHGKTVISAYLLANEQVVKKGVLLAFMAAFVQAMSAIFLVSVAVWIISATGRSTTSFVTTLEQASYVLICLVGLYMIWRAIAGHDHSHDHDHAGHDHHHDHAHVPMPEDVARATTWKQSASIVFAVGIRPCSGAVLVLLFANTLGLIAAGIGATFAMALGTAITVSAIAILTLVSKQTALRLMGGNASWTGRAYKALAITGSIAVFLLGAILLWGSLTATRPLI